MPSEQLDLAFETLPLIINPQKVWKHRILIGTPMTGTVRSEWVAGRYGQRIPTNWSQVEMQQLMWSHIPLRFQVADAENLIAKFMVEKEFNWLLFWEHDNIAPLDAFIKLNQYMLDETEPVVAGLYFTKSIPPEPLIYRNFGWSYFQDWKLGDKVRCKGHGFGFTLIHGSIIKALWDESPEYICSGQVTRRVFQSPDEQWYDPELGFLRGVSGTSDLQFCERCVKDRIFEKAGWPEHQKMEFPFLVDTNIFLKHIDDRGVQYPVEMPKRYLVEATA